MRVELTSLFNLAVYTKEARYVGKVKDVALDVDKRGIKGLALIDVNPEVFNVGSERVIVPYEWVDSVKDIVLIKEVRPKGEPEEAEEKGE